MAVNFKDVVTVINNGALWLSGHFYTRYSGVMSLISDEIMEGASLALKAPWLRTFDSPDDALPYVGAESSMPRYTADTNQTYRARLLNRWSSWQQGGTGAAIIEQLQAFGILSAQVVPAENNDPRPARPAWRFEEPPTIIITGSFTFTADDGGSGNSSIAGPAFSWVSVPAAPSKVLISGTTLNDGMYETLTIDSTKLWFEGVQLSDEGPVSCTIEATEWSRIAVIIEPGTYDEWYYGDGDHYYGDGSTYGSTATVDDIAGIKAIARKWKAGEEINPYVYVILSGEYYGDPDFVYGGGAVYGGEAIKWEHQA